MNKIFKVVWNKARCCYVVASEFAKSRTKSGRAVKAAAVAVAAALTLGMNGLALADGIIEDIPKGEGTGIPIGADSKTTKNSDIAVGQGAIADGTHYDSKHGDLEDKPDYWDENEDGAFNTGGTIAIGKGASAKGQSSLALGSYATAENIATAIGSGAEATGEFSVAVGRYSISSGNLAMALGDKAYAKAHGGVALGHLSKVDEDADLAISVGLSSEAAGEESQVIGNNAYSSAEAYRGIALGSYAGVFASSAVAVGPYATAEGRSSLSFGYKSNAYGENSVAVGREAGSGGAYSIAIGDNAITGIREEVKKDSNKPEGGFWWYEKDEDGNVTAVYSGYKYTYEPKYAIAVGANANAKTNYSIALGNNAVAGSSNGRDMWAMALGSEAKAYGESSTALGYQALANAKDSISAGNSAKAYGTSSIAEGHKSEAYGYGSVALGHIAIAGNGDTNAKEMYSIAVGDRANATDLYSIAVGYTSRATGDDSIAQGRRAAALDNNTIAIGYNAQAGSGSIDWSDKNNPVITNTSSIDAQYAMAIGYSAKAYSLNSLAMGYNATVNESANNATAVGYGTHVYSANNVALGALSNDSNGTKGYSDYKITDDVFSTSDGLSKLKLKVSSFAGTSNIVGTVSVGNAGSERTLTNVAAGMISATSTDAINGSQLYAVAKGLQEQIDNIDISGTGGGTNQDHTVNGNDKKNPDDTNDTTNYGDKPDMNSGNWTTDGNLLIRGDENTTTGNTSYDISLNPNLKLDSVTFGDTVINKDGMKFDENHYFKKEEIKMGNTVITDNSVKVGDTINIDNSQKEITVGANVDIDMGDNQIHNVKAGSADTDAVNYGQLKQVEQNVANNSVQINKLKGRIDKVGAGAAALAALHPLDFDPDDKFYLSAGYGNYRGENAVAVGAFYQPNDDTLFSVSSTVGNDDDMINAGITWRFGQSSHQSRSKKAMAKEIIELRTRLASLEAMIYSMAGAGLDPEKSKLFPDTPENHWAYDYVAVVAGNGILEGYPNGKFDGSRPMTRYEMAAVVYRLLQKGVQVDNRMIQEFAPELARVRVDTLTHYNDGTPHIQRVRVIEGRG